MGPWLCSHGNNEAPAKECPECHASMGPWLCSHGNHVYDMRIPAEQLLQWGRGCVATEIMRPTIGGKQRDGFNGAVAV